MIAPLLAAAAPDYSWADWGYDVSKTVASAIFVASSVAAVGKGIGWPALERLKWRTLWGPAFFAVPAVLLALVSLSENENGWFQVFMVGGAIFVVIRVVFILKGDMFEPPPGDVTESYLGDG
jgi:hypothetical protein